MNLACDGGKVDEMDETKPKLSAEDIASRPFKEPKKSKSGLANLGSAMVPDHDRRSSSHHTFKSEGRGEYVIRSDLWVGYSSSGSSLSEVPSDLSEQDEAEKVNGSSATVVLLNIDLILLPGPSHLSDRAQDKDEVSSGRDARWNEDNT